MRNMLSPPIFFGVLYVVRGQALRMLNDNADDGSFREPEIEKGRQSAALRNDKAQGINLGLFHVIRSTTKAVATISDLVEIYVN